MIIYYTMVLLACNRGGFYRLLTIFLHNGLNVSCVFWCLLVGILTTQSSIVTANSVCNIGWDVRDRGGPDSNGWTMVAPDKRLCSGHITHWSYQPKISGPFRAIVFRPVEGGSDTQFRIVGINDIPASGVTNTDISYEVPEADRITVRAGDVIGWSFGNGVITYNGGGESGSRVRWLNGNLHAGLVVDEILDINVGVEPREYSIEAVVRSANEDYASQVCQRGWPVVTRRGPDTGGWTMVSPDQTLCRGQVTRWTYMGLNHIPFRAIIFRPVVNSDTEFEIVGINEIRPNGIDAPVRYTVPVVYTVPKAERITVAEGDVIGWAFDEDGVLAYEVGGSSNVRWIGGDLYSSLETVQILDFAGSGVEPREYSIAATVMSDNADEERHYRYEPVVCEGEATDMRCPAGRYILVTTATYGRADTEICPSAGKIHTIGCTAIEAAEVVQRMCNGKHWCTVEANNDVFGDPCPGTFKYLQVYYSCIEGFCENVHTVTTSYDDFTFMPMPIGSEGFGFKVRADSNAYIVLADRPSWEGNYIEIALGIQGNQASEIRGACEGCPVFVYSPNILSQEEDRHFNVWLDEGTGELTVSLVGDEIPFMSYQFSGDPPPFSYIGIAGSNVNWTFCNYIPTPTYLGCFIDAGDRALTNYLVEDHEGMTLEKCWAHCRSVGGQRYAGLQYMYQCFCGQDGAEYYRHGQASESDCSSDCSSGNGQKCGGGWRNSVYDLGDTETIRLVGGTKSNEGRLELYYSGGWSTVCNYGWVQSNAHVACRMLGYAVSDGYNHDSYGTTGGDILNEVFYCTGEENNLFECQHSGHDYPCTHADDVSLRCRHLDLDGDSTLTKPNDNGGGFAFPWWLIGVLVTVFFGFIFAGRRRNRNAAAQTASPPPQTAAQAPPNTISSNTAVQQAHAIEMSENALPSYDAALSDTNSRDGVINATVPPLNPNFYDNSAIDNPNLPPPPSYDTVISKSDEYGLPAK